MKLFRVRIETFLSFDHRVLGPALAMTRSCIKYNEKLCTESSWQMDSNCTHRLLCFDCVRRNSVWRKV